MPRRLNRPPRRLVTKTELAKLAGVSQPAITKALRSRLTKSLVGKRIDLDHESVTAWLKSRGTSAPAPLGPEVKSPKRPPDAAPTKKAKPAKAKPADPTPDRPTSKKKTATPTELRRTPGEPGARAADDQEYLDWTLRQITESFGSETAFKDYLDWTRRLREIRDRDLAIAETEGHLISRRLIETNILGAFDAGFRRLLHDAPKTIVRSAGVGKKEPAEIRERAVLEILSSQLRALKETVERVLRNA